MGLPQPPSPPALPSLDAVNAGIDPIDGYRVTRLVQANPDGQIAAELCADVGGTCWAVRLDPLPVPEPDAWLLWLVAMPVLARAGWRPRGGAGGRPRYDRAP